MKCEHCKTALTPHETAFGAKRGALHCGGCGCCFLSDGKTPRDGVPVCDQARAPVSPAEPEPAAEVKEEPPETNTLISGAAEMPEEPRRGRSRR